MQFSHHWTSSKYQMTGSSAFNHNKMGHMDTIDEDDKDYEIKRLKMGGMARHRYRDVRLVVGVMSSSCRISLSRNVAALTALLTSPVTRGPSHT